MCRLTLESCNLNPLWVFPKEWGGLANSPLDTQETAQLSDICTCLHWDPREAPAARPWGIKTALSGFPGAERRRELRGVHQKSTSISLEHYVVHAITEITQMAFFFKPVSLWHTQEPEIAHDEWMHWNKHSILENSHEDKITKGTNTQPKTNVARRNVSLPPSPMESNQRITQEGFLDTET